MKIGELALKHTLVTMGQIESRKFVSGCHSAELNRWYQWIYIHICPCHEVSRDFFIIRKKFKTEGSTGEF